MDPYEGRRVLVAGTGIAGAACVEVLLGLGAQVTVLDRTSSDAAVRLEAAGADLVLGDEPPAGLMAKLDDVIVSPGFAPHTPVARAAVAAGVPVYSEPELAWRLRGPDAPAWLAITGTNGKTTTTTMVAAILARPDTGRLPWATSASRSSTPRWRRTGSTSSRSNSRASNCTGRRRWRREAGALLNLADDHLEWHGTFEAYASAKHAIWRAAAAGDGVAIGNLDDPLVAAVLAQVPGRQVGVTVSVPGPGQLGVVDGMLVDRAFADSVELGPASAVRPTGAHNVSNALHAAALARTFGVSAAAVRDGLAGYVPEPHRNALVATVAGVAYVDDSKATNPHAASASLAAYPRLVWVAGGQLKGVDISDLVAAFSDRMVGAVLLGVDRAQVAAALRRHAPHLPVVEVARTDDDAMAEVVTAAAGLARPGDTVLLAPAAASKDMFISYAHRGDAFAAAVRALPQRSQ